MQQQLLHIICNEKYFFSEFFLCFFLQLQLSFYDANKFCCDRGMTLLSIESKSEYDCIQKAVKSIFCYLTSCIVN